SIESKDTPFLSAFNLISSNHFLSVRIYSIKLFTFLMNSGLRTEYSYSFENVSYALSINPQPNFDRFASVAIIIITSLFLISSFRLTAEAISGDLYESG